MNAVGKLVDIALCALVFFVLSAMGLSWQQDNLSREVLCIQTEDFAHNLCLQGRITAPMIDAFGNKLMASAGVYETSIFVSRTRYEPVYNVIEGIYDVQIYEETFGLADIIDCIDATGTFVFERDDIVNVSVQKANATLFGKFLGILYKDNGSMSAACSAHIRNIQ